MCAQRLRWRRPRVLGDGTRTAACLPIDRWMLARLHGELGRDRRGLPPVAWHGRFTTSPLAEPAYSSPPASPTPFAPPHAPAPGAATAAPATPPPAPAPLVAAAPAARPVAAHEELDPEVRALVDELYEQARAELAATEPACFSPPAAPAESDAQVLPRDAGAGVTEGGVPGGAPEAPTAERTGADAAAPPAAGARPRTGWVPAFRPDEQHRREGGD
jgi:hypothetical protein